MTKESAADGKLLGFQRKGRSTCKWLTDAG